MATNNNSKKYATYLYILLTIVGCILACSTLIPNDYLKLVVVMVSLMVGLYGIMKGLSNSEPEEKTPTHSPEK